MLTLEESLVVNLKLVMIIDVVSVIVVFAGIFTLLINL